MLVLEIVSSSASSGSPLEDRGLEGLGGDEDEPDFDFLTTLTATAIAMMTSSTRAIDMITGMW